VPSIDALITEALLDLATGDPQITNAQMASWWNRRQTMLSSQAKWWFMRGNQNVSVTVATGQGPYTLTGTPQSIEEVLYSGISLDFIPFSQGAIFFGVIGTPKAYSLAQTGVVPPNFYIFPTPDTTYTVNVYTFSRPADLVSGSGSSNVYTDMFPELVKAGMNWAAARRLQEPDLIKQWKDQYDAEILTLLQQQAQFDQKGLYAEPHPSYAALPHLIGGQGGGR